MQATPVGGEARSTGRTDATDLGFWEPEEQGGGRKGKLHGRSNGVNNGRIRREGVSAGGCGGQSRPGQRRRNAEAEHEEGMAERQTVEASQRERGRI